MERYQQLRQNPPKLKVIKSAREVLINTISCMCDNKHQLTLKKNIEGDFKLSGNGNALSNWQMKFRKDEIEWAADDGRWGEVFQMINSGTEKIDNIKSR